MNGQLAIRVRNLSKRYLVYQRPADMLLEMISRRVRHKEVWALRDVSFDVPKGEVVGVVGRNGAGKSTLLKLLVGTLDRTGGELEVNGRVSAILELGTGFHPEFTGRDNVLLGGMALGMSRAEVERKLDSIIEFSELGHVIDQPFKTYSSGMQGRLTFATAISVEPEIFIIDEALATGDVLFQEKCFTRIREIVASGATVFFVTHSLGQVYELCTSAILLSHGELVTQGEPRLVGYAYEQILAADRQPQRGAARASAPVVTVQGAPPPQVPEERVADPAATADAVPGPPAPPVAVRRAELIEYECLNEAGVSVQTLYHGESYTIRARMICHERIDRAAVSFRLELPSGLVAYGVSSAYLGRFVSGQAGDVLVVDFSFDCYLQSGTYLLGGGIAEYQTDTEYSVVHILRGAQQLTVLSSGKFQGVADLRSRLVDWHVESALAQGIH
jgi:ABC-type polysaccharide/polyol phosphate transport system ATPase subunit